MTYTQVPQPKKDSDRISDLLNKWPNPEKASLALVSTDSILVKTGDMHLVSNIASVSKLFASLTCLIAIEEGTIELDEPAGPKGSTVRHLLAHASGLAPDTNQPIAAVGSRRIYSDAGIELLATHLSKRVGVAFEVYQHKMVIEALGLKETRLEGSPAHGVVSNVSDLTTFAQELIRPNLVRRSTLDEATSPQFPDLRGVLPGFGNFDPNPWGLGMEIRGAKTPHWTAPDCSAATFGHFGASGSFLWVDPTIGIACAAISGSNFGLWATEAWPAINQALISHYKLMP